MKVVAKKNEFNNIARPVISKNNSQIFYSLGHYKLLEKKAKVILFLSLLGFFYLTFFYIDYYYINHSDFNRVYTKI